MSLCHWETASLRKNFGKRYRLIADIQTKATHELEKWNTADIGPWRMHRKIILNGSPHTHSAQNTNRAGSNRRHHRARTPLRLKQPSHDCFGRADVQQNRRLMPSSAMPLSFVVHVCPAFTGSARVKVATISPAASGGCSGSPDSSSTRWRTAESGP